MSVVPHLRKRSTTASGFGAAVDYVAREGRYERDDDIGRDAPEAVFTWGVTSLDSAGEEMDALAALGKPRSSPVAHITLSWSEGEHPTPEQAREAAQITMRHMDFEGCQAVAALHRDGAGGYSHLHLIVNRVDADLRTRGFGWYKANLANACSEIEREQGWSVAPYSRDYAGRRERGDGLSEPARAVEFHAQRKSVEGHLREEIAPVIRRELDGRVPTWTSIHATLREAGYRYNETEHGAKIESLDEPGVAIGVKRALGRSHHELVQRLGEYVPDLHANRPFEQRVHSATLDVLTKRKQSATWEQVHEAFEARGLRYERHGGGARIVDLDSARTMKAGDADRRLRFSEMQKKFGEFEDSSKLAERREAREAARIAENYAKGAQFLHDPSQVVRDLTAHNSTFTERDVQRYLERKIDNGDQRDEIAQKILNSSVVLERNGARCYTTAEILQEEKMLKHAAQELARATIPQQIARVASEKLDTQQRDAYKYATRGNALSVITGVPGAGKTTLVNEIAEAYRDAGYNVRATAVSNKACDVLQRETDVPVRNTAKELYEWSEGRGQLTNRDVLIIDEASMLSSEQGSKLLEHARDRGATVIALGDDRQFAAVGRGDSLRAMTDAVGGDRVDMKVTRRQEIEWQREATHTMREGRVRDGLQIYRDHGRIVDTETREEAARVLVDRYNEAKAQGLDAGLVAYTNRDVHTLNALAREGARERGDLSGPDHSIPTRYGERDFAVGDRVVVRETMLSDADRWTNGDTARVVGIEGNTLRLERERDGDRLEFHADFHDAIDHAYASTKHREQGATHDVEFTLASRVDDARSTLVSMTRHKQDVTLAYARDDFEGFDHMATLAERFREKNMSIDYTEVGIGRDVHAREARRGNEIEEQEADLDVDEDAAGEERGLELTLGAFKEREAPDMDMDP